ncbi:uncharacterized protein [Chironomus tepperi]|uniref:uncharacterized protein n=1 Tax=Chironomus tepperi TaxID=113505 RepID=UPI00391F7790
MKWNQIQSLCIYMMIICIISVESHKNWNYYYPMQAYPPFPGYYGFPQQAKKPTNTCLECIKRFENFAKMFNFFPFGYPNFNNGNVQRTTSPTPAPTIQATPSSPSPIAYTFPTVTEAPQTTRPPLPRRTTKRPEPVSRIGIEENNRVISTAERIQAIYKTTNAPVTQQSYFTYPEIKNALNSMDQHLANIRSPVYGLNLNPSFGR